MEMTLEKFQKESQKRKIEKGRRPKPYLDEQRSFAVAYAREAVAEGISKSEIVRRLGISEGTLSKWMNPEQFKQKGFRRVAVRKGTAGSISVVTAAGHRVEGLDLDSAVTLLKLLG